MSMPLTPPRTANAPAKPPQKLLVVRFLDAHLAQGGVEASTHGMLLRMIQLVSAMERELHTINHFHAAEAEMLGRIEWYADCVLEGLKVLLKHSKIRLENACNAAEQLPDLGEVRDEQLDELLLIWRATLKTLHKPTGNDARLFRHFATHFQGSVYHPFIQIHRQRPQDPFWTLNERMIKMERSIEKLYDLCRDADGTVVSLNIEYKQALQHRNVKSTRHIHTIVEETPARASLDLQQEARFHSAEGDQASMPGGSERLPAPMSQSFSAAEEHLLHRGHHRSATVAEVAYALRSSLAEPSIVQSSPERPSKPPILARRKVGTKTVPRIFTGSFSELEENINKLQLHEVKTPEAHSSSAGVQPVRVRDFADTPSIGSGSASPTALLQRREAVSSKDVQWESRMVNGEVVRSRRPSRAQTFEADTGLLEWLEQRRSADDSPYAGTRRLPHRENTL